MVAARSRVALGVIVAGLILWIEVVVALAVLLQAPLHAGGLLSRIVLPALLFAQVNSLSLGNATLERLCGESWRAPVFILIALLFFVIASTALAEPVLPVYFVVLTLVLSHPVVLVLRALRTIRDDMQQAANVELLQQWLLEPVFKRRTAANAAKRGPMVLRLTRAAPWLVAAGGAVVVMFGLIVAQETGVVPFGVAGFMLPCVLVAIFAWRRGQRHLKRRAAEIRQLDPRAPVLILRSFRDDNLRIESRFAHRATALRPTLEELLTHRLASVGPTITIGEPREKLPPLGAAREYLRGADWKTAVERLIDEAVLVVFILGDSENLLWEFATTIGKRGKGILLVVVPPLRKRAELQARWKRFATANAAQLGGNFPRQLPDVAVISFLFCSDDVVLITSNKRTWWDYELAIRLCVR